MNDVVIHVMVKDNGDTLTTAEQEDKCSFSLHLYRYDAEFILICFRPIHQHSKEPCSHERSRVVLLLQCEQHLRKIWFNVTVG